MSRAKGDIAEELAVKFLRKSGFEIVERNFYSIFGEIDIIAKKENILRFIEVKSGDSFEPVYNITPKKLERITKTLNSYIKQKNSKLFYSIDALIVQGNQCELIENITMS